MTVLSDCEKYSDIKYVTVAKVKVTDRHHLLYVVKARVMLRVKAEFHRSLIFYKSPKVNLKQCPVSLLVIQLIRLVR